MSQTNQCNKCGLDLSPKSHNFYFESSGSYHYKCDECITNEAKGLILDGLKKIVHKISFETIKSILDDGLEEKK